MTITNIYNVVLEHLKYTYKHILIVYSMYIIIFLLIAKICLTV